MVRMNLRSAKKYATLALNGALVREQIGKTPRFRITTSSKKHPQWVRTGALQEAFDRLNEPDVKANPEIAPLLTALFNTGVVGYRI